MIQFYHDTRMKEFYLDWAATAPMSASALDTYCKAATQEYGNPSSIHQKGKEAASTLSEIRRRFAKLLQVKSQHIYFTSGGTESNALVCNHFLTKRRKIHIIMSGIEHPSIYEYHSAFLQQGHEITIVPSPLGVIDTKALSSALRKETALILLMTVNNVLGTRQPLKEIRKIIDDYSYRKGSTIHLHADSVQAFGKIASNEYMPYVDSASFSAHKLQGPKGTGILYTRKVISVASPGGGQELGLRPGTEDLPAIASFYDAAAHYCDNLTINERKTTILKDHLIELIKDVPYFKILETAPDRSPYILCISIPDLPSEVSTRVLNDHGIYVSTGSACSSKNRKKMQRVLIQSGYDQKTSDSLIRLSFGPTMTLSDIESIARLMIEVIGNVLRQMGKLRK